MKFLLGFIVGVLVVAGAGYYYFASGMAPVAVTDPLMPFERKMANMALDAHIEKQHVGESPVAADEPNLLAGADVYQKECAVCHGLPDHPVDYVNMMFPKPTQLFKGKGVTDDPPSESYWKVVNGIRLSGMPTFKDKLTNTQAWQVAELVAHATNLPEPVKQALFPKATPSAATQMQMPPAAPHK
ncbi:MAG TPA: cytochrome c [Candidatus Acidoferrales bacterium]|nr:cytochrome c [Candidatus Acidoferrales bacterium]